MDGKRHVGIQKFEPKLLMKIREFILNVITSIIRYRRDVLYVLSFLCQVPMLWFAIFGDISSNDSIMLTAIMELIFIILGQVLSALCFGALWGVTERIRVKRLTNKEWKLSIKLSMWENFTYIIVFVVFSLRYLSVC